jgi:hypothetical protein
MIPQNLLTAVKGTQLLDDSQRDKSNGKTAKQGLLQRIHLELNLIPMCLQYQHSKGFQSDDQESSRSGE